MDRYGHSSPLWIGKWNFWGSLCSNPAWDVAKCPLNFPTMFGWTGNCQEAGRAIGADQNSDTDVDHRSTYGARRSVKG